MIHKMNAIPFASSLLCHFGQFRKALIIIIIIIINYEELIYIYI